MSVTEVWSDADALADAIAQRIVGRLAQVQQAGRTPSIVLTGGTIAIAAYERIQPGDVDWTDVDGYWGDERFVPAGHADRNDQQARDAFLSRLGVPGSRVHAMPASDEGFPSIGAQIAPVLWAITAATLILGNLLAIAQNNVKRMLAYSSISHAGFILMAIAVYSNDTARFDVVAAALFYLLAFAFASFGSWAVVIALEQREGRGVEFKDYAGLARRHPGLAVAMTIFMLSFTGVPPTLGFAGKFFLFRSVLEGGYTGLAIVGVLASLISAYYYLRVVVVMFMQDGEPQVHKETWLNLTAGVSAAAIILLFIFSQPLFGWASQALLKIF